MKIDSEKLKEWIESNLHSDNLFHNLIVVEVRELLKKISELEKEEKEEEEFERQQETNDIERYS